jgi:hypothetical protein
MTPEEIKKRIEQARAQGIPDEATFKYLNDRGLIPKEKIVQSSTEIQPEGDTGIVQSIAQGVAKPVLKIASSVRSLGGIATADSIEEINEARNREYDYGYLGKVTGLRGAKDAIGTGAELGSYLIGGGGAAKTVATGLKAKLLGAVGKGALTGSTGGATATFGQALQDAESKPADIAMRTLFGATVGGTTGGVLGAITPVVMKAKGVTKRFTDIKQVNDELTELNTKVLKPKPSELEKWSKQGRDPMRTFTELFGMEVLPVGKGNRFTSEGVADFVERVDDIYKPASEAFNTILRNSPEVNSISKARDAAIKNLDNFGLTPEMKVRAVEKIKTNFDAILEEARKTGVLIGDDSIPVAYSDNLKDRFWSVTKNFGTEDATVANSVNSSIGHGFKDSIENVIQDLDVKDYNKKLGDLIVLRDFLSTKAGSQAGTGGQMTRLMSKVAGTIAGSQWGPLTAILGNITGDKIAEIMINPAYQPYRWIINKKLKGLPPSEVRRLSDEANRVIVSMFERRMSRLGLPAASPLGTARNPIITPNTITGTPNFSPSSKSAVAIQSQPQSASAITDPTTNPTMRVNSNDI